jgi:hypothetical protein
MSLLKMHKFKRHGDREALAAQGQTKYEYYHSTACGYVREQTTELDDLVDCKLCLREMNKQNEKMINSSFCDSQGCY